VKNRAFNFLFSEKEKKLDFNKNIIIISFKTKGGNYNEIK